MPSYNMGYSIRFVSTLSLLMISNSLFASAFQLWEQDGASVGNYHAGYAAKADDASASFYNPAGIVRIKNQQAVLGGNAFAPSFQFVGDITVNTIDGGNTVIPVKAQGGVFAFVPFFHYVAPISEQFYFGVSVDAPFGLKTNYGTSTPLRYLATLTSVQVVDVSPVLAYQFNDKASIGIGPDLQRMHGEFDQVATLGGEIDSPSVNKADDTAYGYHLGFLYQFSPATRVGMSYHSQVVHHLTGTSKFTGELADLVNQGPIISDNAEGRVTLPGYTALSLYQQINPCLSVMGTVTYTNWSVFQDLRFTGLAGLDVPGPESTTQLVVDIPQHYRNTWSFAIGSDLNVTDTIILRGGLGYDQSPVKDYYRNVQLPDNDRYVVAVGSHFQATKNVGLDISYMHVFVPQTHLNPPPQVTGAQISTSDGKVRGGADVLGGQIVWNFA